jgi:hypothetical protein
MHADSSLFLGKTATMNFGTAHGAGAGNGALSGHNEIG